MRARRRCAHCMKQWSMRAQRRYTHCMKQWSMRARRRYTHCMKQWSMRAQRRYGDPFGATVIQTGSMSSTQMGPRYQNLYAADLFFPNRHAHLSLYQVLSRQSICILCSLYTSYSRIVIVIRYSYGIYIYIYIYIYTIIYSYIYIFHISL